MATLSADRAASVLLEDISGFLIKILSIVLNLNTATPILGL